MKLKILLISLLILIVSCTINFDEPVIITEVESTYGGSTHYIANNVIDHKIGLRHFEFYSSQKFFVGDEIILQRK